MTKQKALNAIQATRIGMIIAMAFICAGGLAFFFLCYLGAYIFEIDLTVSVIPAAVGYPIFIVGIYVIHLLFPSMPQIIAFIPLSKKEETLQIIVELVSVAIGAVLLIVGVNRSGLEKSRLISIGAMFFYVPGMIARYIAMVIKSKDNSTMIVYLTIAALFCVIIPNAVNVALYFTDEGIFQYSILNLLYFFPLILLLTLNHKEDDLKTGREEDLLD